MMTDDEQIRKIAPWLLPSVPLGGSAMLISPWDLFIFYQRIMRVIEQRDLLSMALWMVAALLLPPPLFPFLLLLLLFGCSIAVRLFLFLSLSLSTLSHTPRESSFSPPFFFLLFSGSLFFSLSSGCEMYKKKKNYASIVPFHKEIYAVLSTFSV